MKCNIRHYCALATVFASVSVCAQESRQNFKESLFLFSNVKIFNGQSAQLSDHSFVLIRGNTIEKISDQRPEIKSGESVTNIDGQGRTLMPGLIDAHWHAMFAAAPAALVINGDQALVTLIAGKEAQATLMRGFTSVRDLGGSVFGLKQAIDQGVITGPRIWPSAAVISQTGGHGDFRALHEVPGSGSESLSHTEQSGHAVIADGAAEVIRATREQLMRGASQIKLAAGGGLSSAYDPLDVTQYTEEEIHAAVQAAENWNTYVTVHAYTPRSIQQAIRAGVKSIDHGQLLDDTTAKMMAEKGIWLSIQPFLDNENANPKTGNARLKQIEMSKGTDTAYQLARKYKLKVAFGTDVMFEPLGGVKQGSMLASVTRWYSAPEVLKMATSSNAELLALSGPRSPYNGTLGVVQQGALADLLLIDGDPLKDISLLTDPSKNILVIMKDGKLYKNNL